MKREIVGLLAVGLMAGPMSAYAQATTYDYTGAPLQEMDTGGGFDPTNVTGNIVLSSPLAANMNDQQVTPVSFNFGGSYGVLNSGIMNYAPWDSSQFYFSTSNTGAIIGWSLDLHYFSGPGSASTLTMDVTSVGLNGLGADTYSADPVSSDCPPPGIPQPGNCVQVLESNSRAGYWTAVARAPEIDPASTAGGLTLLLGSSMILRGSRVQREGDGV